VVYVCGVFLFVFGLCVCCVLHLCWCCVCELRVNVSSMCVESMCVFVLACLSVCIFGDFVC